MVRREQIQRVEAPPELMSSIGSKFRGKNTPCRVQISTPVFHLAAWPLGLVPTVFQTVLERRYCEGSRSYLDLHFPKRPGEMESDRGARIRFASEPGYTSCSTELGQASQSRVFREIFS